MSIQKVREQLKLAVSILQKMVTDTNPEEVQKTYDSIDSFISSPDLLAALDESKENVPGDSGIVILWPDSSTIERTVYYPDTLILAVHFKNKTVYQYFPVPLAQYEELRKTDSIGRFYATRIKKEYNYKQIL